MDAVAPGLAVVLAPNPGLMTGPGTNQYVVADGALLIDCAPLDAENRRRFGDLVPEQLLLTHIHPDHTGGALALREAHGMPIAIHASRATATVGGVPLAPTRLLEDGDEIRFPGGRLVAVHTPGHESGHCCLWEPDKRWLFTGDTILSTGTTVVAPPDGDMRDYMTSLGRLAALGPMTIFPGHGPPVPDGAALVAQYIAHRTERETQILGALADGVGDIEDIVARLYVGLHPGLTWAAALTVRGHLDKLAAEGRAEHDGAVWRAA